MSHLQKALFYFECYPLEGFYLEVNHQDSARIHSLIPMVFPQHPGLPCLPFCLPWADHKAWNVNQGPGFKLKWRRELGAEGVCRGWERPTWWEKHSQHLCVEATAEQKVVILKLSLELISGGIRAWTAWKPARVLLADGLEHHHCLCFTFTLSSYGAEEDPGLP